MGGEIVVALAAICFAVLGRVAIDLFEPGVLPFVLTFPAVIFASLFAGWRAGVGATLVCQLLVWVFVLPPQGSFGLASAQIVSLGFSTFSLLLTVWIAAGHRIATMRLQEEKEQRLAMLSLALREVDHRTKNNFQIAASLLLSQAKAHSEPLLRDELRKAASRLNSISAVYTDLALSSANLSTVMVEDYLRELCRRFRESMLPPGVALDFSVAGTSEATELPARTATSIGLIVNECLTNAAKHAFPDGNGTMRVSVRRIAGALEIVVSDDGPGATAGAATQGIGSALIGTLAKSIGASFRIIDKDGRRCMLRAPL